MSVTLKENQIAFAKIRETAIIPSKKPEDAGYDMYANFEEDYLVIEPGKTKAIPNRSNDVWINLKGRQAEGIVEPSEKYELEEEIMTKLYELKSPMTGKRVVGLALRNKDAVLFGLGGPECGDIIYFLAEGYNTHHGDQLSTTYGEEDTSVSPIFVAAGPGFKCGEYTDRIIRQIDFTPTIAALMGVRMPHQCEGAPVYQILEEEF